jgi:hypothetical protein
MVETSSAAVEETGGEASTSREVGGVNNETGIEAAREVSGGDEVEVGVEAEERPLIGDDEVEDEREEIRGPWTPEVRSTPA